MTMTFKEALIAHLQGKKVQVKKFAEWKAFESWICEAVTLQDALSIDFANACQFRIAPRTILVNGVEVPAPEKDAPADGAAYFIPYLTDDDLYEGMQWDSTPVDRKWLDLGLVYLDKESAIARAKAMLITQEVKL